MCGTEDPRLVGASSDGALRAWSTNTGALTSRVRAHEGEARALETSGTAGTGKMLLISAGGKGGVVVARDAISGTIETEHTGLEGLDAELGEVRCVAALRDGRVVAGDDEGRVFVWEHKDTLPCWRWSTKVNVGVESLSPRGRGKTPRTSPDAVNAVCGWTHRQSGEEFVATGNGRGSLQLWRMHQSKALATFDEDEGGHRGAIHAVCDNDGVIITAGADGRVLAWYVNENGELLGPPEAMDVGAHHTGSVLSVINISPGVVCTGGTDQRALIWDVKSRAMMFECPSTKAGAVMSLAFDDSADVLYTGCALNQISRWELPMGERMSPREHANDLPLLTRKLSYDSFESWDQNDAPAAHQSSVSHGSVAVETKLDTSSELNSAQSMLVRVTEELDEMKMSDRILSQKVASLENELRAERASLASAREEIEQLRRPAAPKGETFDATLKAKCEKMESIARKQKSKIDELKSTLKLAVDERRDKCDELEKLSKTVEGLRKELELARSSAPAKDATSLDVEEMMAAAERALLSPQQASEEAPSEIMRELHSIREEFISAEQTISKLNSRLSSVEEEKESISAQHARLVDETSRHADKLRAVQADLDGVRQESDAALTALREQLDQAQNRANALEKELSDATVTLSARDAVADENAKSVDVLTVLQTENAAKDKRIKELDAKHSLARQKLENAVTKGKGFQQECTELKIKLQNAQDEADGQRKELAELKSQLNAARTLTDEFESRQALADAEAERVRAQLSEVQGEASKSDETMAQLHEDLKRADQRVREAEESVASSAERHQAELSELKRKFDSAVQKGKGFQQECAELKKQLQEREATHQEKCDAIMSRAGLNEANVQKLVDTMSAQREELEHLKQDFENTEKMS
ncbi:quinon protein alcohol dehydrogenase-like superfamily, partial [Ostreococcus tauri]